jgi:predicted nicotinamide N-methyase
MASRVEYALTSTSDCLILAAKQAFTREVADGRAERPERLEERLVMELGGGAGFSAVQGTTASAARTAAAGAAAEAE